MRRHGFFNVAKAHALRSSRSLLALDTRFTATTSASVGASLLHESENTALWGPPTMPLATLEDAAALWVRCGLGPATDLPFPGEVRTTDDDLGIDLSSPNAEHAAQSRALMLEHFRHKYLTMLRLERNSGSGLVGVVGDHLSPAADEADKPDTPWNKDTLFARQVQTAKSILGEGISNREELELAIRQASPENFYLYCEALLESPTGGESLQLPTPTPSYLVYGTAKEREAWCTTYQQARLASEATVEKIRATLFKMQWTPLAEALASQHEQIVDVVAQLIGQSAFCKDAATWTKVADANKILIAAWVDQWRRASVKTASLANLPDATEIAIPKDAFEAAKAKLETLCGAQVPSIDLPYNTVWRDCVRLDLLETAHLLDDARYASLSAGCIRRMANEAAPNTSVSDTMKFVLKGDAEALRTSQMDTRGGFIVPGISDAWAKLNWARYGSGGQVQRPAGTTVSRVSHAHYASLGAAKALAALHFRCKSLAAAMDYATPFRYRNAMTEAYAQCAVELAEAQVRPINDDMRKIFEMEDKLSNIATVEKWRVGCQRRAVSAKLRTEGRHAAFPITAATISNAPASTTAAAAAKDGAWRLGTTRSLTFQWAAPHPAPTPTNLGAAERAAFEEKQAARYGVEVSLWKESSQGTVVREVEAAWPAAEKAIKESETLRHCQSLIQLQMEEAGLGKPMSVETAAGELKAQQRAFVAMLLENAPVTMDRKVDIAIPLSVPKLRSDWTPFASPLSTAPSIAPVEPGSYRLRVRIYDHDVNPQHKESSPFAETFSAPFSIVDDLDDTIVSFLLEDASAAKAVAASNIAIIPAASYIATCDHLRAKGFSVPLDVEFDGGQTLTVNGDVVASKFTQLVRTHSALSMSSFTRGVTQAQLTAEPQIYYHWKNSNPGALESEWYSQRRYVLDDAFANEREWWRHDGMIASRDQIQIDSVQSLRRYNVDLATVLSARGESGKDSRIDAAVSADDPAAVRCEVNGAGTLSSLALDADAIKERKWTLDEVLSSTDTAYRRAHLRLNTLYESKFKRFNRDAFTTILSMATSTPASGKYAATFRYAYEKAQSDIQIDSEPPARVSDGGAPPVDRFASKDNPALRRRLNIPALSTASLNMDDPLPEQQRSWKQ